jgi:hypothetical protein
MKQTTKITARRSLPSTSPPCQRGVGRPSVAGDVSRGGSISLCHPGPRREVRFRGHHIPAIHGSDAEAAAGRTQAVTGRGREFQRLAGRPPSSVFLARSGVGPSSHPLIRHRRHGGSKLYSPEYRSVRRDSAPGDPRSAEAPHRFRWPWATNSPVGGLDLRPRAGMVHGSSARRPSFCEAVLVLATHRLNTGCWRAALKHRRSLISRPHPPWVASGGLNLPKAGSTPIHS